MTGLNLPAPMWILLGSLAMTLAAISIFAIGILYLSTPYPTAKNWERRIFRAAVIPLLTAALCLWTYGLAWGYLITWTQP